MADEPTTETRAVETPSRSVSSGATALDMAGGVLGLIVFLAGVALVIATYHQATEWYRDIGPAIRAARAESSSGPERAPGEPVGGAKAAAPGTATARPGGTPLAEVATEFGLRLVWLILMAFIGFIVAALGARLAGAHRGKRT